MEEVKATLLNNEIMKRPISEKSSWLIIRDMERSKKKDEGESNMRKSKLSRQDCNICYFCKQLGQVKKQCPK